MELEQKFEELNLVIMQFKKANDERLAQLETKGRESGEKIEKVEKLNAEIDRLQGEIKAIQTAMNRPGQNGGGKEDLDEKAMKYKSAFNAYMRKGNDAEIKALSVDSDPDGGYTVTPQVSAAVVKKVFESSPLRQLASVETISTDSLEILEDLDEASSGWVGEQQARTETNTPTLKKISIPVHELYAMPKATQKLLDDSAWNMEAWLADHVSRKFARDEATAFISGSGVLKPRGIITYASGTAFEQIEQVISGHATLFTSDGLIDLQGALKEDYQANASWLMQRASMTAIRKLKNAVSGDYLWQPGLQANQPDLLLGKPVYLAADMEAQAAGKLAAAYGDFREGYQIVDRIGIRVIRDVFTAKPFVLFYTTKRVGGGVKNFEALKLQKISA